MAKIIGNISILLVNSIIFFTTGAINIFGFIATILSAFVLGGLVFEKMEGGKQNGKMQKRL